MSLGGIIPERFQLARKKIFYRGAYLNEITRIPIKTVFR